MPKEIHYFFFNQSKNRLEKRSVQKNVFLPLNKGMIFVEKCVWLKKTLWLSLFLHCSGLPNGCVLKEEPT